MTVLDHVDTPFFIVDFDRTLVDTDKLNEVFREVAEQYGAISKEQIIKADADVKRTGDSFDTAGYVRDRLAAEGRGDEWQALEKQYIHESRSLNYLLPGAAELLEWLAASGQRYGILTYGNPLWQRIKLTAAGFNHTHHIIMEQKEKGRFIATWRRADDSYRIPEALGGGNASHVVLIDDKAVSFNQFPEVAATGYWVCDPAAMLDAQRGEVGRNVERYSNLHELVAKL
jgi:FMN phosphatase YigB (HAD superfamily)